MMNQQPSITITDLDLARLRRLSAFHKRRVEELEAELDRAKIVPAYKVPRDVVTLNSRVTVEYESTGERITVTLGYPPDWDPATAIVSVLDPLGSALLGLSVGQSISWLFPDGSGRQLRVLEVADQPETVGQLWR